MDKKEDFSFLPDMDKDTLRVLASDIRADILSACLSNGGHLSSNLGAVELTLSLLKNISCEENDILFDVGHQAYTYKILTGRDLTHIRRTNGISPFNLRSESKFDVYNNGHAGDCLSTGIGIAKAKLLKGDSSYTVCFVGDASIENGLSFEALDYIAAHKELKNLIIVLNDNGMAISKNKGPISSRFVKIRNSRIYFRTSSKIGKAMEKSKPTWKFYLRLRNIKDHLKGLVISPTVFEAMGIKYIGPFDGHDFDSLDLGFDKAKAIAKRQPVILHVLTKKGYGYPLASGDDSGNYHGVSKGFDKKKYVSKTTFTSLKESLLLGPMKEDEKMVLITPAMEKGSGLERLFDQYPERCIDTGIAEENAVVIASGLSLKGYHPIVDIYSTFLQRCYDEIIENISRNEIPVTFFVERAGLVGEDGSSHQGIYDVSLVKNIPYRKVYMPFDAFSLAYLLNKARTNEKGPFFLRFPKGEPSYGIVDPTFENDIYYLSKGKSEKLFLGISSFGYECAKRLKDQFDCAILLDLLPKEEKWNSYHLLEYKEIVFYDPYSTLDATASELMQYLFLNHYQGKFKVFTFDRKFIPFGQIDDLLKQNELDVDSVIRKLEEEKDAL